MFSFIMSLLCFLFSKPNVCQVPANLFSGLVKISLINNGSTVHNIIVGFLFTVFTRNFLFLKVINRLRGKTVCWNEANIWFGKIEERLGQNIDDDIYACFSTWCLLYGASHVI